MRWLLISIIGLLAFIIPESDPSETEKDAKNIKRIFDEALVNGEAYNWLDYLANEIGGRLSGSPQAAMAVEWSKQVLDTLCLDSVWLQPVMVPHWIRGKSEFAKIHSPGMFGDVEITVCALGGSVGTGKNGVFGQVIEINSYDQLDSLGENGLKNKIVFYNVPMDQTQIHTFHAYGHCSHYRRNGAVKAAGYGAKAVIVRSLTLSIDDDPHTGNMSYKNADDTKKIPGAAISTLDAEFLSEAIQADPGLKFYLRLNCRLMVDKLSYNVIGEIKGSEYPDEIILVGGHLDSWDNGDGAHDDGAGCVHSMEMLRLFKTLKLKPKRTLRCVLFMNEENGAMGARKYAEEAERKNENHILAIESDAGGFVPRGFSVHDSLPVVEYLQQYLPLLKPYNIHKIVSGYGGVDISFLEDHGTVLVGLMPDSQRYFDYHHSPEDTFDKVNRRELLLGAAAITSMVYLVDKYGLDIDVSK